MFNEDKNVTSWSSLDRNTKFHYKRSNIDFISIGKWKIKQIYIYFFGVYNVLVYMELFVSANYILIP